MQDIIPPARGTIRPAARTSPERAYQSTRRPSVRPSSPLPVQPTPAPISPAVPGPTPTQSPLLLPKLKHASIQRPAKTPNPTPTHKLPKALSRTTHKLFLIHRLNERQNKADSSKHPWWALKNITRRSLLTGLVIGLILLVTGYVSFDTWQTNNRAKQAFTKNTPASDTPSPSVDHKSNEGKDESPLPKNALANYKVAPNLPRALYINKLNISARILPMGVNNDGSMQAPFGIYDAGWYSGSARPGETGAMVVNGHSSGPTRQALFGRLDTLKDGDEIVIEKGDMTRLRYKVVHSETIPLQDVDMNKVSLPYGTAKNGLNIYTCTGKWLADKQTFDHRVIVYAVAI